MAKEHGFETNPAKGLKKNWDTQPWEYEKNTKKIGNPPKTNSLLIVMCTIRSLDTHFLRKVSYSQLQKSELMAWRMLSCLRGCILRWSVAWRQQGIQQTQRHRHSARMDHMTYSPVHSIVLPPSPTIINQQ